VDGHGFDALAKALAAPAPRRAALRLLAGGALGGLLASLAGGEALADKKKKCKASEKRCGNKCIPKRDCCKDYDCGLCRDEVCIRGRCRCAPGLAPCGGRCTVACNPDEVFTPGCACCKPYLRPCANDANCCSGLCRPSVAGSICVGRESSSDCGFDAQCDSGSCVDGTCA